MIDVFNKNFKAYERDISELLQAFFPGELNGPENGIDVDDVLKDISLSGIRKEDKSLIKKRLYLYLSELTKKTLPWGTLTGIRPVKLAESMDDKKMLQEKYLISDEKADLMLEIYHLEKELLRKIDTKNGYSIYIGIPFCPTTCLYCSFTSYPIALWSGRVGDYLSCIEKELRQLNDLINEKRAAVGKMTPDTLYIGGGTPTSLSEEQLDKLLCIVEKYIDTGKLFEYTVESGRPDSISEEKLKVMKDHGVERMSINPQTMNQKTLDIIGRRHTAADTVRAYEMARKAGFDNINMDLIMGLPGESIDDVSHTLSEIEKLAPDDLTVHALAVKRASRLNTGGMAWGGIERAASIDEVGRMIEMGAELAEKLDLHPYYLYRQKNMAGNQENTGYAAKGKESLYNIFMMEEKETVFGIGAGSSTKVINAKGRINENKYGPERLENIKNISEYLPRIDELLMKKEDFLRKTI